MKREKRYRKIRFLKQTIQDARKILTDHSPAPEDWLGTFILYDDDNNSTSYDTEEDFLDNYNLEHGTGSYSVWTRSFGLSITSHSDSTTVAVTAPSLAMIQTVLDVFENKYKEHKDSIPVGSDETGLHPDKSSTITIDRTFDISGFVIGETDLARICRVASELVRKDGKELSLDFVFTTSSGEKRTFTTIAESLLAINNEQLVVSSFLLSCRHAFTKAVSVAFDKYGRAAVLAVGSSPLFTYEFENLAREIRNLREDYSWSVRTFIHKDRGDSMVSFLILAFTVLLIFFILSFLATKSSLVPFDDKLLVTSSDVFYQKVEHAMKSHSPEEKIDVLLLSLIKDLRPGSGTLHFFGNGVVTAASMLFITGVIATILRFLKQCYPLSLFIFEWNHEKLEKLKRRREVIWVGVIIGFVVNIGAGLVIAFVMK